MNEALVRQLDGCEFMEKAENVVLVWDTQEKLRDAQIAESDAER
ncbi:hypothetical protein ABIE13_000475 [Ottowia thiooxydans]|uniref:Uncharacterized protein n=1 Tax=Ottowia thiooxydans TaxID=219182 RepID=A0ABV2Q2W9_9BURK